MNEVYTRLFSTFFHHSLTMREVYRGRGNAVENFVYIRSGEFAWVPAQLLEQDENTAKVVIPQYESEEFIMSNGDKGAIGFKSATIYLKEYQGRALPLQNCDSDGSLKEVDDLVDLPHLHPAAILYNLKKRLGDGKPYSRLGDIVIAVNPYQWLGHLYTNEVCKQYAQKIVWDDKDNNDRDPRDGLPPHIYEVSSLCYKSLAVEKRNQSILVTGISGAGKTETVKILMNHIATIQSDSTCEKSSSKSSMIVNRILDSNRLLETFGNAKTRHNENSSRFGKYTMLQFHHCDTEEPGERPRPRPALVGSTCEVYLLEKSRVVFHDETEGTFHAFYQLLAAPDDKKVEIWKGLEGTTNESYAYVGTAPHVLIDGKDYSSNFIETNAALERFGISGEKYLTLWRAVAACLQLGNLTFAPMPRDEERTVITSSKALKDLAELIGCDHDVLERAFTERTMKQRYGGNYKVPLKSDMAKELADAFAKEIYVKTFFWLVRSINDATCAKNTYPGTSMNYGFIGLLDIFGFESFAVNGFEQFCINYCNEKLQQKFTRDIFRSVEEEYKAEGLDLDDIKYDDNSDVLELIESHKLGIIGELNNVCLSFKGNDETFVTTVLNRRKKVPWNRRLLFRNRFDRLEFGIHHYAGAVKYKAQNFVARNMRLFVAHNKPALTSDLSAAAKRCKNEIISIHLHNDRWSNMEIKEAEPSVWRGRPKGCRPKIAPDSVMTQFKTQLTNLMEGLSKTQSHYVCCIKPNTQKRKLLMEHVTTMDQLRGAGLVSAALMSRSTYSSKLVHADVVERFSLLNKDKGNACYPDVKNECEAICNQMLQHFETTNQMGTIRSGYAIGETRAYFRSGCLEYLESERSKMLDGADDIDSWVYCASTDSV